MPIRYDIALNNNDINIYNGDFFIAESDTQHVIDSLNAFQGWYKEFPTDGVGLMSYTKSSSSLQELNRKIMVELTGDGYSVKAPLITLDPSGNLFINPNAELL